MGRILHHNETESPLGANQSFTGDWENVNQFGTVTCSISSSSQCSIFLEFNSKDTGEAKLSKQYLVEAGNPRSITRNVSHQFFRVRIQNGASPQSYLDVQSIKGYQVPSDLETKWQWYAREGMAFVSITGFVTVASTTETDFMLLKNPSDSNTLALLKEFILTVGGNSSQRSMFRFYRNPTITNDGTPITINKVLATGNRDSGLLAFQNPTISSRGSIIQLFSVDFNSTVRDQDLARFLVSGGSILFTVQGSATNLEHNILTAWAEEPA